MRTKSLFFIFLPILFLYSVYAAPFGLTIFKVNSACKLTTKNFKVTASENITVNYDSSTNKLFIQWGSSTDSLVGKIEVCNNNKCILVFQGTFYNLLNRNLDYQGTLNITTENCNYLFGVPKQQPSPLIQGGATPATGGGGVYTGATGGGISVTENRTERIIKELERLRIKDVIEKAIPIEKIQNIEIKETKVRVKSKVIEEIQQEIKKALEKVLGKKIILNLSSIKVLTIVQVINISLEGRYKVYTKIERHVNRKTIEYIPKNITANISKIIVLQGKYKVLESDPIIEFEPENGSYVYLIEGDVYNRINEIKVYTYSYKVIEKPVTNVTKPTNVTNVTQPTKPKIKPVQNVTKPNVTQQQNITIQKPTKPKVNILPIIVAIVLAIIGGIIYYLIRIGKLKIEFLERLIKR